MKNLLLAILVQILFAVTMAPLVSQNTRLYARAQDSVAPAATNTELNLRPAELHLLGLLAPSDRLCSTLEIPPGQVKRVHDGDTFTLYSVGVTNEESVRVLGVNTPELGSGPVADSATVFTRRWLLAAPFTISVCQREKYGRLLAAVTRAGKSLADTLITLHLGVKYP